MYATGMGEIQQEKVTGAPGGVDFIKIFRVCDIAGSDVKENGCFLAVAVLY